MARRLNFLERAKSALVSAFGDRSMADELGEGLLMVKDMSITSAQLLALNDTAIEVIAAPGANKLVVLEGVYATIDYGTATYASGSAVTFKYTGTSGLSTGVILAQAFVQAAADDREYALPANSNGTMAFASTTQVNAAIYATASSNFTTGDSVLFLRLWYRILPDLLNN